LRLGRRIGRTVVVGRRVSGSSGRERGIRAGRREGNWTYFEKEREREACFESGIAEEAGDKVGTALRGEVIA
jgi:hypothetical protein